MSGNTEADDLFTRVLVDGTDEAIEAWLATGPTTVHRLRQELTGERRATIPRGTSMRLVLDNLGGASHETADSYPDEFLAAFADESWNASPTVTTGLGAIRRPEVTERLMRILESESHWLRISAAAALRGHEHPNLEAALVVALDDPDELVRYHVAERLAEMADDEGCSRHER